MKLDSSEFKPFVSGGEGPASRDWKKRPHEVCGSLADIFGSRPSLLLISSFNQDQPYLFGQKLVHTYPSSLCLAFMVPIEAALFSIT
jgi:hypothetical protein